MCFTFPQIRFTTFDCSDAHILVKGTVTEGDTSAIGAAAKNRDKKIIFKNYAPFINSVSNTNNTQVNEAHDIDVVMLMYVVIEYSDNYSKTSIIL